jgi:hypothetical protein
MTPWLPIESRFVWLLGNRSIPDLKVDTPTLDAACNFALREWQALPVVAERLLAWAGADAAAEPRVAEVLRYALAISVRAVVQEQQRQRLGATLAARRIPHLFVKSSATGLLCYDRVGMRGAKDIDLGVPRRYVEAARTAAQSVGFVAADWSDARREYVPANMALRKIVEAEHYELGFMVRELALRGLDDGTAAAIRGGSTIKGTWRIAPDGTCLCYICADIHHGLSLSMPVDEPLAEAMRIRRDGSDTVVASHAWCAFLLVMKLYWEGVQQPGRGAYQYADLVRLVPLLDDPACRRLLELLARHQLEAAGHYVLRRLPSDFSTALPPILEDFVAATAATVSDTDPRKINDLGDMWPRLWKRR